MHVNLVCWQEGDKSCCQHLHGSASENRNCMYWQSAVVCIIYTATKDIIRAVKLTTCICVQSDVIAIIVCL